MVEKVKVKYSAGRTINTGNYESTRFDVGIEATCDPNEQEEVFDGLKEWVEMKVKEEEMKWKI